ncbi:hypothetical protein AXG93_1670s1000 [Marchantia polymorpha subsp. ruderalis]|uniref:Uncharacterized protein n=1 Tax=Marchantia polymorpha subsp. ruderalis TaxID=1480154 RepID=A0A176WGL9_MARPO|nr:hypothetical protein AXG93_1670s1000 [Marchantia polymorpha subsp. ruderalis]
MKAHKRKNLYILKGSTILGEPNATTSLEYETRLWHACLGHMREKGMCGSTLFHTSLKSLSLLRSGKPKLRLREEKSAISYKTPFEMWHKRNDDYSYLRVFGCDAYAHLSKESRTKLDPKATKCIFLGYQRDVKGYRLWDPVGDKLIVSRDVSFNGSRLSKEGEIVNPATNEGHLSSPNTIEGEIYHEISHDGPLGAAPQMTGEAEEQDFALEEIHEEQHIAVLEKLDWDAAMQKEMKSLHDNQTWELVELPNGKRAIYCKWVYAVKDGSTDAVEKIFKARLVAKGFEQRKGIDYTEGFIRSAYDPCVYMKRVSNTSFGLILLVLYVDDMLIAAKDRYEIIKLKVQLSSKFNMKDLGLA